MSVVIPTKNPGKQFAEVFHAVKRQQTDFEYGIIVVDSGTTDGSLDFLEQALGRQDRLIEIQPSEFGHGKTRNFAMAQSNSEYCAFLTHDALPATESWLQQLVLVAESDPWVAGVFGRHIAYPNASFFTKADLEKHFQFYSKHPVAWMEDEKRYWRDVGYRQHLHFFSDNNSLLRRSAWEEVPFPDVNFAEDQAWAKAVIEAGWKKAYSHDAAVLHSHDFNVVERLQRSFDESFSFHRDFGYILVPNFASLGIHHMALFMGHLEQYFKAKGKRPKVALLVRQWLLDFSSTLGSFLGSRSIHLPGFLLDKVSWDKKLFSGRR